MIYINKVFILTFIFYVIWGGGWAVKAVSCKLIGISIVGSNPTHLIIITKNILTNLLSYNKNIRKGNRIFLQLPGNGQKTRSNNRNAKKINLNSLIWYYTIFIKYYNFVYPVNTRIFFRAQIINKLFFFNWTNEWCESRLCAFKLMKKKSKKLLFNLEKASRGQIAGYVRTGAASKRGKARSKINSVSVGMPLNMINCFLVPVSRFYRYGITTK